MRRRRRDIGQRRDIGRRRDIGQGLTELGPAMLLLLVAVLFPVMVIIYVGIAWSCGWFLNQMCTQAAAVAHDTNRDGNVSEEEMNEVMQPKIDAWMNSGLAAFTKATIDENTARRARGMRPVPNSVPVQLREVDTDVSVTTVMTIQPFIQIPFLPLGPFTFTYTSDRPVEDTGEY